MSQSPVQLPRYVLFIRVGQAVLNVIICGLTAYSASVFGVFNGFALDWFTFIWTMAFLGFAFILRPRLKTLNPIIALIPEVATTFWWLVTFAVLASDAGPLNAVAQDFKIVDDNYGTHYDAALGCTTAAAVFGAFMLYVPRSFLYVACNARDSGTTN
jgi:hypothetical protein